MAGQCNSIPCLRDSLNKTGPGAGTRWREIDFPQALLVPQRQVDVRVAMADRHNSTGKLALLVFSPCPTMMSRYLARTGECDSGGDPQRHCLQLKHRTPSHRFRCPAHAADAD